MDIVDCRKIPLSVGDTVVYLTQSGSQTSQMVLAEVIELAPCKPEDLVKVSRFLNSHGRSVNRDRTVTVRARYVMKVFLPDE